MFWFGIIGIIILCIMLSTGCSSVYRNQPKQPPPPWHGVLMPVRTNLPSIHFYDKINPIWWFGNADEPKAPPWYRPGKPLRNVQWYIRNPFANFANYVIGVGDKETTRYGRYPTKIGNPNGGWNVAWTRYGILFLPFVDYKHSYKVKEGELPGSHGAFEFYFGWRERGNFGIKLNFDQKPPRPPKVKAQQSSP